MGKSEQALQETIIACFPKGETLEIIAEDILEENYGIRLEDIVLNKPTSFIDVAEQLFWKPWFEKLHQLPEQIDQHITLFASHVINDIKRGDSIETAFETEAEILFKPLHEFTKYLGTAEQVENPMVQSAFLYNGGQIQRSLQRFLEDVNFIIHQNYTAQEKMQAIEDAVAINIAVDYVATAVLEEIEEHKELLLGNLELNNANPVKTIKQLIDERLSSEAEIIQHEMLMFFDAHIQITSFFDNIFKDAFLKAKNILLEKSVQER